MEDQNSSENKIDVLLESTSLGIKWNVSLLNFNCFIKNFNEDNIVKIKGN